MIATPLRSAECAITDPRFNRSLQVRDARQDLLGEQIDELNDRIADLEATVARLTHQLAAKNGPRYVVRRPEGYDANAWTPLHLRYAVVDSVEGEEVDYGIYQACVEMADKLNAEDRAEKASAA